jgi:DnaJ-class molecular chaperone
MLAGHGADMRCEPCQGTGYITKKLMPGQPDEFDFICKECQGLGIVYCCDEAGANPPNTKPEETTPNGKRQSY